MAACISSVMTTKTSSQAAEMEPLETAILADLGYPDPYLPV